MSNNGQATKRLNRIAKNSEERGTVHYNKAKEMDDDLSQLKAMISSYRTSISATLTGLKIQALPRTKKKVVKKR